MSLREILVAVRPKDLPLVSEALGNEFGIVICHTLKDAEASLNPNIGMVACGVHFDEGAMFHLLKATRSNPGTRTVPFHLLLADGSGYSEAMLRGIRSAAKLLGANGFTDLARLKTDVGRESAYERVRTAVRLALYGSC